MITKDQVIPLLKGACASFQTDSDETLLYLALGDFARHLLDLYRNRQTESFADVARAIEKLHIEGDSFVREAATIGLLEGIQNVWSNNQVDPQIFFPFLLPESARWWSSLNDFWSGKSKYVGEGLQP